MRKACFKLLAVLGMAVLMFLPGTTVCAKDLSGELEIFSWWAGDEGPALEALIELYKGRHPKVTVINATVTGGS
jgi:glucose/mannose transport system substrate-binding protein